mmetsp:Transcript_7561/g.27648  ORF Transcript_7561/g.27648 Transcript_7561/m.27648 type:complete len:292 (+) Transcript_7561:2697-3572(+)
MRYITSSRQQSTRIQSKIHSRQRSWLDLRRHARNRETPRRRRRVRARGAPPTTRTHAAPSLMGSSWCLHHLTRHLRCPSHRFHPCPHRLRRPRLQKTPRARRQRRQGRWLTRATPTRALTTHRRCPRTLHWVCVQPLERARGAANHTCAWQSPPWRAHRGSRKRRRECRSAPARRRWATSPHDLRAHLQPSCSDDDRCRPSITCSALLRHSLHPLSTQRRLNVAWLRLVDGRPRRSSPRNTPLANLSRRWRIVRHSPTNARFGFHHPRLHVTQRTPLLTLQRRSPGARRRA